MLDGSPRHFGDDCVECGCDDVSGVEQGRDARDGVHGPVEAEVEGEEEEVEVEDGEVGEGERAGEERGVAGGGVVGGGERRRRPRQPQAPV